MTKIRLNNSALILATMSILLCVALSIIFKNESSKLEYLQNRESYNDSIVSLSFDMEDIVECAYSNRGYRLSEDVKLRRADGEELCVSDTNPIYAYVTPLACWTCIRSINKNLINSEASDRIIYIIPNKFSNNIQTLLNYAEIPSDRIYFASSELGLPVEGTDRMFLFTLENNRNIENVFAPSRYSQDLTEIYLNSIITNN